VEQQQVAQLLELGSSQHKKTAAPDPGAAKVFYTFNETSALFLSRLLFRCPSRLHDFGQFFPSRRSQATALALLSLPWASLSHRRIPALHGFRNVSPGLGAHCFLLRWSGAKDSTSCGRRSMIKLTSDFYNFRINFRSIRFESFQS
jgi:hypothetical protein